MMTTDTQQSRYRFVVRSAEEAVTVIRDRFGGNARVVSVRQVEGAGLARFLQAPKLEVIAEVNDLQLTAEPAAARSGTASLPVPEPALAGEIPAMNLERSEPGEVGVAAESRLARLLHASGLPVAVLARLRALPEWVELERLPMSRALSRLSAHLRDEFQRLPQRPVGDRVAFVGTPGAGKTTALCKWLASEVFFGSRRATVLKLDLGHPNPGDGLAVFCEAMGVVCARDIAAVPTIEPGDALYVDVPGVTGSDEPALAELGRALDQIYGTTRAIVINAAYDSTLIKHAYRMAERLGCTHVVFTHLDELTHWGKLWEFILNPALTPLFLSTGQNITCECEPDAFETVLARTFPALAPVAAIPAAA